LILIFFFVRNDLLRRLYIDDGEKKKIFGGVFVVCVFAAGMDVFFLPG